MAGVKGGMRRPSGFYRFLIDYVDYLILCCGGYPDHKSWLIESMEIDEYQMHKEKVIDG